MSVSINVQLASAEDVAAMERRIAGLEDRISSAERRLRELEDIPPVLTPTPADRDATFASVGGGDE